MKKRLGLAVTCVVVAGSLIGASSAAAAAEFGDACVANEATSAPVTLFEFSAPGNPLPTAAPVSGILTRWSVNLVPEAPPSIPTTLKVLRVNESALTATLVGEGEGSVIPGSNSFAARIPVQAGDRLGIAGAGPIGTLICATEGGEEARLGAFVGVGAGSSGPYEEGEAEFRVPVTAVVEPDVDGDGYGDDTQDGCPQSAAYHSACPVVTLNTVDRSDKNAVTLLVAASTPAPVAVTGTVNLGKGKKATLTAAAQTVSPGQIAAFRLTFSKQLKKRLKALPPKKKLTISIAASATNVAGQVSTATSTAKLKGQG